MCVQVVVWGGMGLTQPCECVLWLSNIPSLQNRIFDVGNPVFKGNLNYQWIYEGKLKNKYAQYKIDLWLFFLSKNSLLVYQCSWLMLSHFVSRYFGIT